MRILLINSNRFVHPYPIMPSGLLCIAEVLTKAGHNVYFLDLCLSKDCHKEIHDAITNFKPALIGISIRNLDDGGGYSTTLLLDEVREEVIIPCKQKFTGPIIIGGPAVGINGPEMLEFFGLEYAVRGDGESVIVEFAKRIEAGLPLEGLDGLIIRKNGKILQDPPPLFVKDLNSVPFPKPHKYLNLKLYRKFGSPLQIQTKRGCILKCSYCVYNKIEGYEYRLRNPESVAEEIYNLVKTTGINHIEFTDSNFNIPLNHAKEVLRNVIKKMSGVKLKFRTMGLNPSAVDEELVDLMQKVGFLDVDLGVDTLSDTTLKSLGKNYTKEKVLHAAYLLHKNKIPITWFCLVGAPAETKETLLETLDTLVKNASRWDLILICQGVRLYNGTPFAEKLKQENPSRTKDNFLTPLKIRPEKISLDMINFILRHYYFQYPNIYLYDPRDVQPLPLVFFANTILKVFSIRQPIWRALIIKNTIEKMLGVRAIKRFLFESQNRELLNQFKKDR